MGKLLEVSVVARRLNCSSDTVIRMIGDPRNPLKGVRLNKRALRVLEDTIDDLLRQRIIEKDPLE